MIDQVTKFIDFMTSKDCAPANASDIRADDKWHDFQIAGDSSRKLKGYYILSVDGDMVTGAVGDRRVGDTHQYRGQPTRKFTDEERREYARRMEESRKRKEVEQAEQHETVARASREQWDNAKEEPHPYLTSKGITPEFSRVDHNGYLLTAMYADKKLWGVQSIDNEGTKLFKKGGRKKGCYTPLATSEDSKDVLYICEGFATGKSIREATGGMVLVAYDCNNMIEVAKDKRTEYPQSAIVLCADNDAGKDINAGLIAANKAAELVGGVVIYPEFADGDEGSDFNDYERHYGEDALREYIEKAIDSAPEPQKQESPDDWLNELPPIEAYDEETQEAVSLYEDKEEVTVHDDSWKSYLSKDSKGNLKPRSLNNVSLIIEHSPKFKDMFCYDEFANEKKIVQCPPWEKPKSFKPRTLTDEDVTWLSCELEKHGLTLGMDGVKKILNAVVTKKKRNPAKEYFNNLEWDGVPRLDTWLDYYADCKEENKEYVSEIGKKFLVALVSRVMNAGCKFDHMLILEGAQGVGKSTLLKTLSTIHGKPYFTDGVEATELGTDKAVSKTQGVLIVELAELTGLHKTDMDRFKQQITIQEDRIVLKYKNEPTDLPRQFVLVGTINPTDGYLDDPTGLRRFWPVETGGDFKIEELERDREQLFAEAMKLYRAKYPIWMDKKLGSMLEEVQEKRKLVAPWQPDLEELTETKGDDFIIQKDIWQTLNIDKSRRNSKDMAIIAKIMTGLGYIQKRKTIGGKKLTGWEKKDD